MKIPHFITIDDKLVPLMIGQDGYLVTHLVDTSGNLVNMPGDLSSIAKVSSNPGDKIPGIYEQLLQYPTKNPTAAVNEVIYTAAVPAGYIWHVQCIAYYYSGTIAGRTYYANAYDGANYYPLATTVPEANTKWAVIPYNLYLTAGYKVAFNVVTSEAGKTMILSVVGVTMRVVV